MSSLLDKLRKSGSITASTIAESNFFNDLECTQTEIPAINIALGGSLHGGISPGLLMVAGPSKTFKTAISLYMVSAYMQKYPDAICLFYDSEFGSTPEYFKTYNIDTSRILHIPLEHLEQLKFDITQRLKEINKGDKVIIFIDSVGNLASKKEVDDALEEKSTADMTRAKQMKSLWRMVTPSFRIKNVPCIAINHTYMEMGLYPKAIISGGTGGIYSANDIWIISKSQEKDSDGLTGFKFTINIEKSRTVIEKSKIPVTVTFEDGIKKYSGILDLALESGHVKKPSNGWYQLVDMETGELIGEKKREAATSTQEFLGKVLLDPTFEEFVRGKYKLTHRQMLDKFKEEDVVEDVEQVE